MDDQNNPFGSHIIDNNLKFEHQKALHLVRLPNLPKSEPRLVHDELMLNSLEQSFKEVRRKSFEIDLLFKSVKEAGGDILVYGGWVRDHVHAFKRKAFGLPIHDIDLVAVGVDLKFLQSVLKNDTRKTLFGGLAIERGPIWFDIWPLQDTYFIRLLRLTLTPKSLLSVTDFNINAVIFSPEGKSTKSLLELGCLDALEKREIGFNFDLLPFPTMQAARLIIYASKLGLYFDRNVERFLSDAIAKDDDLKAVRNGILSYSAIGLPETEVLISKLRQSR